MKPNRVLVEVPSLVIILSCVIVITLNFEVAAADQKCITVNNSEELKEAIKKAVPAGVIMLGPTVFQGEFVLSQSGTPSDPIVITGSNDKSKIIGQDHESKAGTAFTITGSNWRLTSFTVENYHSGVSIQGGSGNVLSALVIHRIQKAVEVRGGYWNQVSSCVVGDALTVGIHLTERTSNTILSSNTINGAKKASIVLDDTTCCGDVRGSVADGMVEVNGSKYSFEGNVFQGPVIVNGCDNYFRGEVSPMPFFTSKCQNHDAGGNVFI